MLDLHRTQLVQAAVQVFGHPWTLDGFWAPNITKLIALMEKADSELAWVYWAYLYHLLNSCREYVLSCIKVVKPLHQLLGQDAHPLMQTGEYIYEVVRHVFMAPFWLNVDLSAELRIETRVSSCSMAVLLLQCHPDKPQTWILVASWGHCLEAQEKLESCILLELKLLHEETWRIGKFKAISQLLGMHIVPKLHALCKVIP